MDYRIAVIKGDGIGPEVVEQALLVLDSVAEKYRHGFKYEYLLAGGAALEVYGVPLPAETVNACKSADAVFMGAVGDPRWDSEPGTNRPEAAILGLRKELGLFANIRPALILPELASASPLKQEIIEGSLDIVIVRELTGGIYFGPKDTGNIDESFEGTECVEGTYNLTRRGIIDEDTVEGRDSVLSALVAKAGAGRWTGRTAYDVEIYSEYEIARIGRIAFDMAKGRKKLVTSIDKSNVLESSRLWAKVMAGLQASAYPDIELRQMYVDNAAQQLIKDPKQFDVIVTSNMFGDIISDEASQITGSIGMLPSASLGEGRTGLYEPIHGSAPKYAGADHANPIATILSAAMMLRYSFSLEKEASAIEAAVSDFLAAGYRTPDIAAEGTEQVGTKRAGELIAGYVKA
ncbi:MAG: 3-isopropylmalate dehydrogenase [Clostridiales Family XIII bacterium]|nr:3-isopropylmalate dehydrogenase [Clostridiales Family XIII bacterium]